MNEDEFLYEIQKIGLNLVDGKMGTLSELRSLERNLDLVEIYRKWDSKETKFFAYFVKQIVSIIWRNFAVDTPVELNDEQMKKLSRTTGSFLVENVNLFYEGKAKFFNGVYSTIINDLFSLIIEADKSLYMKK